MYFLEKIKGENLKNASNQKHPSVSELGDFINMSLLPASHVGQELC